MTAADDNPEANIKEKTYRNLRRTVGVFMIAYAGHDERDDLIHNIAGFAALGVAIFATRLEELTPIETQSVVSVWPMAYEVPGWVGTLHLVFTGLLLLAAAAIAICFFTRRSAESQDQRGDKVRRNYFYIFIGSAILLIGLVLVVGITVIDGNYDNSFTLNGYTFILEAVVFILFGIAWLTSSNVTFHLKWFSFLTSNRDPDSAFYPSNCAICRCLNQALAWLWRQVPI